MARVSIDQNNSSPLWRMPTVVVLCQRADDLFGTDVMKDIYESIVSARIIIADIKGETRMFL
jgi:hypothetical protein